MKTSWLILLMLVISVGLVCPLLAAEKWTPQQKEVWAVEEKIWSLNKPTDLNEMLSYYHPDYMGWGYDSPIPYGKESVKKWMKYVMETRETVIYEIVPLAIEVHGDWAFVDYFYSIVTKDKKGEEKSSDGRWTDILMKEGGKWLFIGDHGGKTSK